MKHRKPACLMAWSPDTTYAYDGSGLPEYVAMFTSIQKARAYMVCAVQTLWPSCHTMFIYMHPLAPLQRWRWHEPLGLHVHCGQIYRYLPCKNDTNGAAASSKSSGCSLIPLHKATPDLFHLSLSVFSRTEAGSDNLLTGLCRYGFWRRKRLKIGRRAWKPMREADYQPSWIGTIQTVLRGCSTSRSRL